MRQVRGRLRLFALLAAVLAVGACATASAVYFEYGSTYVSATATMQPRELPKRGGAPITLSSVTRIGSKDGTTPETLKTLEFLVDKHGTVNGRAFPVCTAAKLEGTTTPQARRRC